MDEWQAKNLVSNAGISNIDSDELVKTAKDIADKRSISFDEIIHALIKTTINGQPEKSLDAIIEWQSIKRWWQFKKL